jgi:hypothetical protein
MCLKIMGSIPTSTLWYETIVLGYTVIWFVNILDICSQVDVDPILNAMVAVPISDLYGNVVGCLEFVCGPNSPKMRVSVDPSDKKNILFPQAAEWLTHQVDEQWLTIL